MMQSSSFNFSRRRTRQHGTILILTMTLCFALTAVVLLLARKMSIEATAAANQVGAMQADEVERAGEQYVISLFNTVVANGLEQYAVMDNLTYTEDYFAGIPVGTDINNPTGWFWILRPQYDEDDLPLFGLVDECSKIDINWFGQPSSTPVDPATATARTAVPPVETYVSGMLMLPNMTDDIASSMYDWRDDDQSDEATHSVGSESPYYLGLESPYPAKNAAYDHVEELLLVAGITPSYLFGDGTADPLGELSSGIAGTGGADDPQLTRGIYDLLTTHGIAGAAGQAPNTGTVGLINVNTAPRIVLQALLESVSPGSSTYADAIVAYRQQNAINPGDGSITWFQDAVSSAGAQGQYATRITGSSAQYSADILAVSRNGRGFKRVRVIFDASTVAAANAGSLAVPANIVCRRDFTDKGWPLNPAVLESIRATGTLASTGVGGFANTFGGTQR